MGLGVATHYVYYRRTINTPNHIVGPFTFNGTGVFEFYPSMLSTNCTWSVEPAAMFQVSSGTGERAVLNYATPFTCLAPKATITFTFSYGCDNHYTVSKEFDLRIPTTTISGNAVSEGFVIDANAVVTVTGTIRSNENAKAIVPVWTKLVLNGGTMTSNGNSMWPGIEVWGNSDGNQFPDNNGGDFQLTYYHNAGGGGQTPDPARLHRVTPVATTTANACLPHYGGNGPLRSGEEKDGIEEAYLAARAAYASLERLHDSRIDGGNTTAETADIATAAPSDLWRLRAKLLGHSPYLSHEALTAAADRDDLFPDATLFEILAANPDELKKDTLIRYMENKSNPMPQYMTDLLRQMAAGTTARTAVEAMMGRYARDFSLAAGDIVRSNLADTVADPEGLRAWLGSMEGLAADRMAVASLVQQGDFAEALALANSLPYLYGLHDGELAEHEDYMALLELHHTLAATGRNTAQMDAGEVAMVEAVADNGTGLAQAMAVAMLSGLHDDRAAAFDCPTLPTASGGRGGQNTIDDAALSKALGFKVGISPNPASTWAAVDYTLPADAATATLTLTNTLGVAVMTAELNGSQGQKVLDLRPLAAGVYGYAVQCGGHVQNGKIVVTK